MKAKPGWFRVRKVPERCQMNEDVVPPHELAAALDAELTRLRGDLDNMCDQYFALEQENTRLRAALQVFANPDSWRFERADTCEGSRTYDELVWEEPWVDQGDKWSDGSVRIQPVKNPVTFAKQALEP
jgi:hypothetical protein